MNVRRKFYNIPVAHNRLRFGRLKSATQGNQSEEVVGSWGLEPQTSTVSI